MPRRHFIADLQAAQTASLPSHFSGLAPGDEDGSFNITYEVPGFGSQRVSVQGQVTDVGDYPSDHSYFVYTTSDNVPKFVDDILSDPSTFNGLKIPQLIAKLARKFDDHTRGSLQNPYSLDSDDDNDLEMGSDSNDLDDSMEPYDNQDESDGDEDLHDDFDLAADFGLRPQTSSEVTNAGIRATAEATKHYNARIRADMRKLKNAGFRVSCYTAPFDFARDFYLSVSCRIAKLNISEDALQAWSLTREKYIVLMLHYTDGYKTFDEITTEARHGRYTVSFRVAVSSKRKGSRQETIDAFSTAYDKQAGDAGAETNSPSGTSESLLEKFFIDRPLNELMNGRFIDIVRLRQVHDLSWDGAERFFQDHQAMGANAIDVDVSYFNRKDPVTWKTRPSLHIQDHFASGGPGRSLPLVAMEFMLRHMIQCTEFCLVCHTKLDTNFEALKPYVCSKPLCLYQYMSLGFGPSMEHEILSQPHVVDLLVSFCYSRAQAGKLDDLPIGMGLMVPDPKHLPLPPMPPGFPHSRTPVNVSAPPMAAKSSVPEEGKIRVTYDENKSQMTCYDVGVNPNLRAGDWVVIEHSVPSTTTGFELRRTHRKVVEAWLPVIRLARGPEAPSPAVGRPTPPVTGNSGGGIEALIHKFGHNFDELERSLQHSAICHLLDVLPTVSQMKAALLANRNKTLAQIFTDMSPASLGILRWIVASNRSCIVAIDDPTSSVVNTNERVHGMPGYMQFRFAQGAPDKEQRFMTAVQGARNQSPPTLWAWHGSDIANWHSIIREGLHFKAVTNGRAYGDGIYNALDANTSMGYTTLRTGGGAVKTGWQKTELNIGHALSLNEIVNSPKDFQSSSPFLVVQHLDWVQTRILCVQCNTENKSFLENTTSEKPNTVLEQDKTYTSKGIQGQALTIPSNAISASRRRAMGLASTSGFKKLKLFSNSKKSNNVEEVLMSDASDDEDRVLVDELKADPATGGAVAESVVKTDFVPGSLVVAKLPRLPPPSYATNQASKALSRALKDLQKTQNASPTAELGWHLCEEALDNIYQWIVELHTFDEKLPLAVDLKSKNLTSVVLELRFGPEFPFTPPFVRVIQPRFLGFQQGGGGHVTAGGALCMELLTNDGWSAVSSIEAVLLQVKMAMSSTEPKPARLQPGLVGEYHAGEAIEAYKRACMVHGWTVPKDFQQIASASADPRGLNAGYYAA